MQRSIAMKPCAVLIALLGLLLPGATGLTAPPNPRAIPQRGFEPRRGPVRPSQPHLVKTMKAFRSFKGDRQTIDLSLMDVLRTFEGRNPKSKPATVRREESVTSYGGHQIDYAVNGNQVSFIVKEEDRRTLLGMNPRTMENLVLSLSGTIDRARAFYRRVASDAGLDVALLDESLPRSITLNLYQGGWQYSADADHGTVSLGYKVLMNDPGIIVGHELYHLLAGTLLNKKRGSSKKATPLNEALADYFAAVAFNQPRLGKPVSRRVKNTYTEAKDGQTLATQGYHEHGQILSGCLWRLRKAVNRLDKRPFDSVSYVDKLAMVAHKDFTDENYQDPEVNIHAWIQALVKADEQLSGGKYRKVIERVGQESIGSRKDAALQGK